MAIDYSKRAPTPPPAAPTPPPPVAAAPPAPVRTGPVVLTKGAPKVSLAKSTGGKMTVNLNWTASAGGGGLFRRASTIDLDLGCLFELTDGRKGVVQALGNSFGSLTGPPYVMLDGDDRSGSSAAGETLTVDLDHLAQIRRVLVYAFIYEGAPAWDQAHAVVTLNPVGQPPVVINLDEHGSARFCALAMLTNEGGALAVERLVEYIEGSQRNLDQRYGWGLQWTPGKKD